MGYARFSVRIYQINQIKRCLSVISERKAAAVSKGRVTRLPLDDASSS